MSGNATPTPRPDANDPTYRNPINSFMPPPYSEKKYLWRRIYLLGEVYTIQRVIEPLKDRKKQKSSLRIKDISLCVRISWEQPAARRSCVIDCAVANSMHGNLFYVL
ncbi:hypothetical protein GWI33_021588 [Rhynchophorus ferrugineus]|uniref:Uncharacterized protein n=1 Tax=Rhynchophorus ferrugineus TaxID=354439 RepID=A0A834MII5_RHYFE|nr:hypothetical protein GWI33_021588 [Rhynchophorus ferrugineus]